MPAAKPLNERFHEKYIPEPNSGCWLWTGSVNRYGRINNPDGSTLAHRVSWELHNGDVPEGFHVLHRCNVTECVNPDHLFLGTHQDNMQDMIAKGRKNAPQGTDHGMNKLCEEEVLWIRQDPRRYSEIAKDFEVSWTVVSRIKSGKIWKHLKG